MSNDNKFYRYNLRPQSHVVSPTQYSVIDMMDGGKVLARDLSGADAEALCQQKNAEWEAIEKAKKNAEKEAIRQEVFQEILDQFSQFLPEQGSRPRFTEAKLFDDGFMNFKSILFLWLRDRLGLNGEHRKAMPYVVH